MKFLLPSDHLCPFLGHSALLVWSIRGHRIKFNVSLSPSPSPHAIIITASIDEIAAVDGARSGMLSPSELYSVLLSLPWSSTKQLTSRDGEKKVTPISGGYESARN